MKRLRHAALGWVLLVTLGAVPAAGRQWESVTKRYPLPAGGQVTVGNVLGSIRVVGWDRAEVELTAVKMATDRGSSPADARVAVESNRNAIRVRTIYRGESRQPVSVDYRLRVPRQVSLVALHSVNGDIVVRNLEGVIEVQTLNGHITQTGIVGSVVAQTVNGSVRVALRALPDSDGTVDLQTINGDVELRLPAQADADLELHTITGRIESNLFHTTQSTADDTTVSARLGQGGVQMRLRTTQGNLRVVENNDLL